MGLNTARWLSLRIARKQEVEMQDFQGLLAPPPHASQRIWSMV